MSDDTSGNVYRLHSTLELPLETVHEFFEDADLPDGVADVEITRRNNTLILQAVAATDVNKYTPTAQLKASVTENRVYEEEPPERERRSSGGPAWGEDDEEDEPESELVEFAAFKGDRETVLQNSTLQYEMFLVLRELALEADKGSLTAIVARDGQLQPIRIVDGEDQPASIEVVESPSETAAEKNGVDWRDNKFISD